jgi:hypothetical protein
MESAAAAAVLPALLPSSSAVGASFLTAPTGLLPVAAYRLLTVYLCARSVLCRWWCSSPTSATSPPPEPSSPGSSSPEPSSRTPPAYTTAAMVGLLPPRVADPTLPPRAPDHWTLRAADSIALCSSPQPFDACVRNAQVCSHSCCCLGCQLWLPTMDGFPPQ